MSYPEKEKYRTPFIPLLAEITSQSVLKIALTDQNITQELFLKSEA